jgi:hypothetical protein
MLNQKARGESDEALIPTRERQEDEKNDADADDY